ncbi:class I SAM-dependent methyltransferase [Angustibacter sp. McL0619]|uniref:class I SAM-dependent methyltransferase n=1 Tax=Angustibacter sp. McL0619 TaxID=3415676 RepID=UPI003CF89FF1
MLELDDALAQLRSDLLDPQRLVRAVAAGRRRTAHPSVARAELRPVDLKSGRVLQVVTHDGRNATTRNTPYGAAAATVDALLAEPFGNWHVETVDETVQLRVTKKGAAQVHRAPASRRVVEVRSHDRIRQRLLSPDDPLFGALGADGDKRRQVDAFLRLLEPCLERVPTDRPVRVVDLGCGNAYLTFAAHRFLAQRLGDVQTVGVDIRPDVVERNTRLAAEAGLDGLSFQVGSIADAEPFDGTPPVLVLALHACDTATDDALARATRWGTPVVLAAPCCHHDVQRQLAAGPGAPNPYGAMARHPILRERFADVLTDSLRALVLRMVGYKVDVVEFVDSRHTPRNAMIRAIRTPAPVKATLVAEYRALTADWNVHPALARLLDPEVTKAMALPRR